MCKAREGERFAHFQYLLSVHFIAQKWVARRIGRSAVRGRQRLKNTSRVRLTFDGGVACTYFSWNIVVKVAGVPGIA